MLFFKHYGGGLSAWTHLMLWTIECKENSQRWCPGRLQLTDWTLPIHKTSWVCCLPWTCSVSKIQRACVPQIQVCQVTTRQLLLQLISCSHVYCRQSEGKLWMFVAWTYPGFGFHSVIEPSNGRCRKADVNMVDLLLYCCHWEL